MALNSNFHSFYFRWHLNEIKTKKNEKRKLFHIWVERSAQDQCSSLNGTHVHWNYIESVFFFCFVIFFCKSHFTQRKRTPIYIHSRSAIKWCKLCKFSFSFLIFFLNRWQFWQQRFFFAQLIFLTDWEVTDWSHHSDGTHKNF